MLSNIKKSSDILLFSVVPSIFTVQTSLSCFFIFNKVEGFESLYFPSLLGTPHMIENLGLPCSLLMLFLNFFVSFCIVYWSLVIWFFKNLNVVFLISGLFAWLEVQFAPFCFCCCVFRHQAGLEHSKILPYPPDVRCAPPSLVKVALQ